MIRYNLYHLIILGCMIFLSVILASCEEESVNSLPSWFTYNTQIELGQLPHSEPDYDIWGDIKYFKSYLSHPIRYKDLIILKSQTDFYLLDTATDTMLNHDLPSTTDNFINFNVNDEKLYFSNCNVLYCYELSQDGSFVNSELVWQYSLSDSDDCSSWSSGKVITHTFHFTDTDIMFMRESIEGHDTMLVSLNKSTGDFNWEYYFHSMIDMRETSDYSYMQVDDELVFSTENKFYFFKNPSSIRVETSN